MRGFYVVFSIFIIVFVGVLRTHKLNEFQSLLYLLSEHWALR